MHVSVPIVMPCGRVIPCENLFEGLNVHIQGVDLPADLIQFDLMSFDVILGMDWLTKHRALVDCAEQKVSLRGPKGQRISYKGVVTKPRIKIVSALSILSQIRKGYPAYLCHVHDESQPAPGIDEIPVVSELEDVFPDEIRGMPPNREVEFGIDLVPGTAPISKAPYRMAPAEMKELREQLQELLDKGYIRPSVSPWGAPVLFVKKKDGSLRLCIDYRELN